MSIVLIEFNQALEQTQNAKRHLLLGNGFSMSLFRDRFSYKSLLEEADFTHCPLARTVFDVLKTPDFELVIQALRQSANVLPLYSADSATVEYLCDDAEAVKELLVKAVAGKHPARPSEITDEQYASCRRFLGNFAGGHRRSDCRGYIYSLNYDLLLYWTLLHDDTQVTLDRRGDVVEVPRVSIDHVDGFHASLDEPDADYVVWGGEEGHKQNIHFLHGALHIYDYGYEFRKKCWERSGRQALVDQIRGEMAAGRFPLYVAEGDSESKLKRINHSSYLHRCLRSFRGSCDNKKGSLFIFGHSLAENDRHILTAISRGKIPRLYVSLYGDPKSALNRTIIGNAEELVRTRGEEFPLQLSFFSADSAEVWGRRPS